MGELDPAGRTKRDPRIVAEGDAELAVSARLEPIIFIDRHGDPGRHGSSAVGHRRGPRQRLDEADWCILGTSRECNSAGDDDQG